MIGWYMHPGETENMHSRIVSRFMRSKRIVHFVGADIYWLRKFPMEKLREFAGALKLATSAILCENELAQEELRSYGIDAEIVPIPPYTSLEVKPLPDEFSVALYLTQKSNFDKYLLQHTLSIVKAMPDVKFYGYGDADVADFKAKNFEHKGKLNKQEWTQFVYDRSAYLRIVRHDTRPMASDEFILAGRDVITNIPAPFMEVVDTGGQMAFDEWDQFAPGFSALRWPDTKKKLIQAIRRVRDNKKDHAERLDAASFYAETLDRKRYIEKIKQLSEKKEIVHVI
jgi:hypothetical protein